MATTTVNVMIACLSTILFMLPLTVNSDLLSPLISPVIEKICDGIPCGKGTCMPNVKNPFFYECECDQGWKQPLPDHDNSLKFLPCVIPNCTLNHACHEAPSPVPQKSSNDSDSLDPCRWVDCGGGSCNKTSSFTYDCLCAEGHHNLLNTSAFPCFKECAIGLDCANLGIPASNRSSPPSMAESSPNQGGSHLPVKFHRIALLIVSLSIAKWK